MITYAANPMIGTFNQNTSSFEYKSYAEVYDISRKLSTALQIVLGNDSSQVVCLRCSNEDFLIADSAIIFADFVCGPIATSVAPSAMKAMFELTNSKAIIISSKEMSSVASIINECSLKLVVVMGSFVIPENWPKRTWLMSLEEALNVGKDITPIRFSLTPQDSLRCV
jgi:long-subunit acyl-CoA synthetase (AMP-forming)